MNLTQKSINYVKAISAEIITKANSGHTGIALGAATILFALFKDHLRFDTKGQNINRDRFVLSAGHGSALYYTILYAFGYDVDIADLEGFRKIGSVTAGHPEYNAIKGIEATTGPLGQGVANSVGLAIAAKQYKEFFNVQKFQIIDNKVYCFVGDGCLMEGVAQEALSLAGNLKLNNLIILYDYNKMTIDGKLTLANSEDIGKKYTAMGFKVIYVSNGNDYGQVTKAIEKAKNVKDRPVIVIFRTRIGFGSLREDDASIHGTPLTPDEFKVLKEKLGITTSMFIPNAVLKYCGLSKTKNDEHFEEWKKNLFLYKTTHPELFKTFEAFNQEGKVHFDKLLKQLSTETSISGRDANALFFNEVASKVPSMIGGSADLFASTKVYIKNGKVYSSEDYSGRNIYFGVREHAMASVSNGIALFDDLRVFNSTFLVFSQYMMPAIRLSAMMGLPVWYFFTHDSIYIGEDGPTHQPIEHLGQLRLIPNLTIFRPADPYELAEAYNFALSKKVPVVFILSRQSLPIINKEKPNNINKGAYVISSMENAKYAILASGSEVSTAIETQKTLAKEKIYTNVISVPSTTIFDAQSKNYTTGLLKQYANTFAIEASNDNFWYKYTKNVFGLNTFGMSGKGVEVAKAMKFDSKNFTNFIKNTVKVKK
jgi:transketolase